MQAPGSVHANAWKLRNGGSCHSRRQVVDFWGAPFWLARPKQCNPKANKQTRRDSCNCQSVYSSRLTLAAQWRVRCAAICSRSARARQSYATNWLLFRRPNKVSANRRHSERSLQLSCARRGSESEEVGIDSCGRQSVLVRRARLVCVARLGTLRQNTD